MNNGLLPGNATSPKSSGPEVPLIGMWGPSRQLTNNAREPVLAGRVVSGLSYIPFGWPPPAASGPVNTGTVSPWFPAAEKLPCDMQAFSFVVNNTFSNNVSFQFIIDVAVGPAGRERVVISKIPVGFLMNASGSGPDPVGPIPLRFASGDRVSVRATYVGTSGGAAALELGGFQFHRYWPRSGNKTYTLPEQLPHQLYHAESIGTGSYTVNTKNTWGTYGIAPFDVHWVVPMPTPRSATVGTAQSILIDYGYRTSTSTDISLIENIASFGTSNEQWLPKGGRPVPVNIPAGTILVSRYQSNEIATTMIPSIILIGA